MALGGSATMQVPLQITFRNMRHSDGTAGSIEANCGIIAARYRQRRESSVIMPQLASMGSKQYPIPRAMHARCAALEYNNRREIGRHPIRQLRARGVVALVGRHLAAC